MISVQTLPVSPAQLGGLAGIDLGQVLIALVAVAVIVLVGRAVIHVAWRLVTIALLVVAVVYAVSRFASGGLPL